MNTKAFTSPRELVNQINQCSNEFISRIPELRNKHSSSKTPATHENRKLYAHEYKVQIEKVLAAAPTVNLEVKYLYDSDHDGVIIHFSNLECEYESIKKSINQVMVRTEQREVQYITLLRKTLFDLMKSRKKETPVTPLAIAPTPIPKKKPMRYSPEKKVIKKTPSRTPGIEKINQNPGEQDKIVNIPSIEIAHIPSFIEIPTPVTPQIDLPMIQLNENERQKTQEIFKQLDSLQLIEIRSWSLVGNMKELEILIENYSVCKETLTVLINELETYISPKKHKERTDKLEACTEHLKNKPHVFKATQQQGNGVYKNLDFVKRNLSELSKNLVKTEICV